MSLTDLGEQSRSWPWIKAIANLLTIPGTKIGLETLTTLQDDLTQDQFREKVKAMLEVIYLRTADILERLKKDEQITIETGALRAVSEDLAEELYLKQLADKFFYADFKGIEQQSRFVSLPLDDIFVDLKATPEDRESTLREKERELRARLQDADEEHRPDLLRALEELEVKGSDEKSGRGTRPADELLSASGPVVLLGGPGSGKTTLVKRLARSCALGPAILRQRYPRMPWCFPVVLPITQFATERSGGRLLDFLEAAIRERGGESLLARYRQHWQAGRVLLMLDGLDEVAQTAHRIASARAVDEALGGSGGNRVLVTSRRVGYAICRLTTPARHFILAPFSPQDITTFVEHWHLAYETAAHEDKADLAGARKAADALNSELRKNTSVASLATNPLMLTIIALIKRQNVILPHRRVELYEVALNTLLRSWNLARSLAPRPPGEEPRIEQTRAVWSHIAFWMHSEANRDLGRDRLHGKLVQVLTEDFDKSEYDALAIAESYLASAAETSGLLEPRGPGTFGFVHQSFQEYLAALFLARPPSKALKKISCLCHDPRWTEVIRLAVGHLSIALGERETVGEIVDSLLGAVDPLEPFLCGSLRLAIGCLADQVDLRQAQADAVLVAAAERIIQTPYEETRESLVAALEGVEFAPGDKAQTKLLELLPARESQTRIEAIRLIGLSPCPSPEVLDQLQAMLGRDQDRDVRAYAAWTLWRKGQRTRNAAVAIANGLAGNQAPTRTLPDDTFLSALVSLLADPVARVRFQAAEALGNCGHKESALPVLVDMLADPDRFVRSRGVAVLGNWGPQEKALPALLELLGDPDPEVGFRAAALLGKWGPQETALSAMVKLLAETGANMRYRAAAVLGDWAPQETALPALVKLLADPDADVRYRAVATLGNWGQKVTALPPLIKLLAEPDANVRQRAAEVLGNWGQKETAVLALVKLLAEPDANVRLRAAEFLGSWGQKKTALPALLELLQDQKATVRSRAAAMLGNWGPQEASLLPLVKLLTDPDSNVRSRAAAVLGNWGPQETAVPTLVKLLTNPDANVRSRVAAVFGSWGPLEAALAPLLKLLTDPDADVRSQTAEVLSNWGPQERTLTPLVTLLTDPVAAVRTRAVEIFGNWGPHEKALPALVKLLADPDANLRYRAAMLLANWGQKETALPAIVELLADPGPKMRTRAAVALDKWGHREAVLTEVVLKKLAGKADPAVLSLLQQSEPAPNKHVGDEARAALAALLLPQSNDSPEVKHLRILLHGWVWRTLAATAS